jgi:hypothetical protein
MEDWEEGKFDMLVQTMERDMQSYLSTSQRGQTEEKRATVFNMKML